MNDIRGKTGNYRTITTEQERKIYSDPYHE